MSSLVSSMVSFDRLRFDEWLASLCRVIFVSLTSKIGQNSSEFYRITFVLYGFLMHALNVVLNIRQRGFKFDNVVLDPTCFFFMLFSMHTLSFHSLFFLDFVRFLYDFIRVFVCFMYENVSFYSFKLFCHYFSLFLFCF